jgi:hypothetical protein
MDMPEFLNIDFHPLLRANPNSFIFDVLQIVMTNSLIGEKD